MTEKTSDMDKKEDKDKQENIKKNSDLDIYAFKFWHYPDLPKFDQIVTYWIINDEDTEFYQYYAGNVNVGIFKDKDGSQKFMLLSYWQGAVCFDNIKTLIKLISKNIYDNLPMGGAKYNYQVLGEKHPLIHPSTHQIICASRLCHDILFHMNAQNLYAIEDYKTYNLKDIFAQEDYLTTKLYNKFREKLDQGKVYLLPEYPKPILRGYQDLNGKKFLENFKELKNILNYGFDSECITALINLINYVDEDPDFSKFEKEYNQKWLAYNEEEEVNELSSKLPINPIPKTKI